MEGRKGNARSSIKNVFKIKFCKENSQETPMPEARYG